MPYFERFLISAIVAVALILLVLLMRRSLAEKGAHIAADARVRPCVKLTAAPGGLEGTASSVCGGAGKVGKQIAA